MNKLENILESYSDDISKLEKIKKIGNLNFSKVFWLLKRIIINQEERILNLEMDLEKLLAEKNGDSEIR